MPEPSIIDARLAEIDRRLRTIQSGLAPADSPVPEAGPPEDPGEDRSAEAPEGEIAQVAQALEEPPLPPPTPLRSAPDFDDADPGADGDPGARAVGALVDELRELSGAHERLLELHRELLAQYAEMLERRAGEPATIVAVNAGPFSEAAAVREFEQALSGLGQVAGVTLREYLGGDRVIVDVRLATRGQIS